MAYIDSSKINIYPSAYRNGFDPESYLNTEYNLTHTKQLSSKIDSFAFEKQESVGGALVNYIYIYLKGYYFKCTKSDILSLFGTAEQSKPIWAQIKINTENISTGVTYTNTKLANLANDSNQILDSSDATPKFQGISFTNAENAPTGGYSLKVLEYINSNWVVPVASQTKLSTTEILNGDEGNQSIDKQLTTNNAIITNAEIGNLLVGDISSSESSSLLSINHKNLILYGDIDLPANSETNGTYVYGQEVSAYEVSAILIPLGTGSLAIPRRDSSGNLNAETATSATSATTATNVAGGSANVIPYQTATGTTGFITENSDTLKKFLTQTNSGTPVYSSITLGDLPDNITNAKLANSSITLWGKTLSLGSGISNLGRLDKLKTKEFKAFAGTEDDNADANCVSIEWSSSDPLTAMPTLRVKGGSINCDGSIQGATVTTTSDARLKENVVSYTSEKSILDLDVKKFDFINGEKNQIGCIAQDLKEICPEIVSEDKNGYLSIQESKIVYLLLNEVKKLKEELEKISKK